MRATCLALALCLPAAAWGESTLSVEKMEINGMEVRDLSCTLTAGEALGLLGITASLSHSQKELDRCAPQGAAFLVSWTWEESSRRVKVEKASVAKKEACVVRALGKVPTQTLGTCKAMLLVGKRERAQKAAEALLKTP